MRVGSLFAGIGGFDLGFERAGMRTLWQVEQEPFRRAILERRFPDAERFGDIRDVDADCLKPVDLICGGFPCEDVSHIGLRAGIGGVKSGLWTEYARLVRELRPRFVVVENVAGLLTGGGMGRVLGDLAASGYDAEWEVLPAAAFGAPHLRARVWLLAYPALDGDGPPKESVFAGRDFARDCSWWQTEPDVDRVADGLPDRVERLEALGDALVPQVAEWIGRRILNYEQSRIGAAA
jgi:DNA (cytosine-5)-methyltransferase 1